MTPVSVYQALIGILALRQPGDRDPPKAAGGLFIILHALLDPAAPSKLTDT